MREKHLIRTNKLILLVHIVTTVFALIGLGSQLLNEASMEPYQSLIPMACLAVGLAASIIVFFKFQNSLVYPKVVGIAFSLAYALMLLLGKTGAAFPYMIPFLLVFVFTLEFGTLIVPVSVYAVINLIRVIMSFANANDPNEVIEACSIEVIITVLVAFVTIKGIKLLKDFFSDSIEEITTASEQNKIISNKIVDMAGDVAEYTSAMASSLDEVINSTMLMNNSMKDITGGVDCTTEAIMNQTMQTNDIQNIIEDTHTSSEKIINITENTKIALAEGTKALNELFLQVNNSINENTEIHKATSILQEKISQVQGITNIILGISAKTNLLALNASIEAARAGESGKGFAVVADEIRILASQTRQETQNITSLIDELSENANIVGEKVNAGVESSNKENECTQVASEKLNEITKDMEELSSEMQDISKLINNILNSNCQIVDNVNTISAASEQVNASTHEAETISDNNMRLLNEFKNKMDSLVKEIDTLKSMI